MKKIFSNEAMELCESEKKQKLDGMTRFFLVLAIIIPTIVLSLLALQIYLFFQGAFKFFDGLPPQ